MQVSQFRLLADYRFYLCLIFVGFHYFLLVTPQVPMLERSFHVLTATLILLLYRPLKINGWIGKAVNAFFIAINLGLAFYYFSELERLQTRIENVSEIFFYDIWAAIGFVLLLLECVRRIVGNVLLGVILAFLAYGYFGYLVPGTFGFRGLEIAELSEMLVMGSSGILGITAETSVNFIFYFVVFGVVYSAVGGGELFIDCAMRMVGKTRGGGAKVAIIGSSLMGTISGSAVANVTATGVFTIPLMKKTGLSGERAGATEAIASTGGQLMPPIMGIAAFVMAEMLILPYTTIALAALIPAIGFYVALFIGSDLFARKNNSGTLADEDFVHVAPILPRIHLALPPVVLVYWLVQGMSAQMAVMYSTLVCLFIPLVHKDTRLNFENYLNMVVAAGRQCAAIAVPIASIGIVITVAIQSNLAIKFASGLVSFGEGSIYISLLMVVLGCIVMGMGLPTVAAYIIGAILYVPAIESMGYESLQAHFFVMYFCVLSMVTPPVSLAAFAAAGIANTDAMKTSVEAFKMCSVSFLIPFAFLQNSSLLFVGDMQDILIAGAGLVISILIWTVGVTGYLTRSLNKLEQLFLLIIGGGAMLSPVTSPYWVYFVCGFALYSVFNVMTRHRFAEKSVH